MWGGFDISQNSACLFSTSLEFESLSFRLGVFVEGNAEVFFLKSMPPVAFRGNSHARRLRDKIRTSSKEERTNPSGQPPSYHPLASLKYTDIRSLGASVENAVIREEVKSTHESHFQRCIDNINKAFKKGLLNRVTKMPARSGTKQWAKWERGGCAHPFRPPKGDLTALSGRNGA